MENIKGTDANVFITMYDKNSNSGEIELKKSEHFNKFERNQCDTFKINASKLNDIRKIKIRHDNSGPFSPWFLEKVEIFNPSTYKLYLFYCQNWLCKESDGKPSRDLYVFEGK